MSRRTFKCNNIQQNVTLQTQNLKIPIKPPKKTIKPNKTTGLGFQKKKPGFSQSWVRWVLTIKELSSKGMSISINY